MPWPIKDIAAINEQWKWFREMPVVLGGYFTSRHVENADVVLRVSTYGKRSSRREGYQTSSASRESSGFT